MQKLLLMLHEFILKHLSNTNIYSDKLEIVQSKNKLKTHFFCNCIYTFRENGPLQGLIFILSCCPIKKRCIPISFYIYWIFSLGMRVITCKYYGCII